MNEIIGAYSSPFGEMTISCDGDVLTGLWIDGQKYDRRTLTSDHRRQEHPVITMCRRWLDIYFDGGRPDFTPPLSPIGTPFQREVWSLLLTIPYGETTTYGALAAEVARRRQLARMSAQAIGGAVGHNPISIIVPCHRVVGTNGSLTGYAGGIERKVRLLQIEGVDTSRFTMPRAR